MTEAPTIAQPDDLPFQLACDAYRWTSFTPEQRARADQQAYADDVNGFYEEMRPLATTDEQKALLAHEMEKYRSFYLQRYMAYLASHAHVASPMITGPARFPVARNEKRGRWADAKRDEWLSWRSRAREAIQRKLLDARPEQEKEDARWQSLARDIKGSLSTILAIDEGREPWHRPSFVNSIAGKVERLALAGEFALVEKALALIRSYNDQHGKPAISERHTFWTFAELARQKAEQHDARADALPENIAAGNGVEIVADPHAARVRIVFAAKPSVEVIGQLKAEGWHWSRREEAWQRKLTEAAKASARRITGL